MQEWFQDRVGWAGEAMRRSRGQRWLDEHRSIQDYADLDGEHVWTVLTTVEPQTFCGLEHPEKGGACVMPPNHAETPHVWNYLELEPCCFVLSLSVRRQKAKVDA